MVKGIGYDQVRFGVLALEAFFFKNCYLHNAEGRRGKDYGFGIWDEDDEAHLHLWLHSFFLHFWEIMMLTAAAAAAVFTVLLASLFILSPPFFPFSVFRFLIFPPLPPLI